MKFPMDSLRTVEPNNKENLIKFSKEACGYFKEACVCQRAEKRKENSLIF